MGKKTTRVRRTFTPQFKRDAVNLVVHGGKTVTAVAGDLGIARSLLQRWKEALSANDNDALRGKGCRSTQSKRFRELEKKLRDTTEERDILKKALAYFADDQK